MPHPGPKSLSTCRKGRVLPHYFWKHGSESREKAEGESIDRGSAADCLGKERRRLFLVLRSMTLRIPDNGTLLLGNRASKTRKDDRGGTRQSLEISILVPHQNTPIRNPPPSYRILTLHSNISCSAAPSSNTLNLLNSLPLLSSRVLKRNEEEMMKNGIFSFGYSPYKDQTSVKDSCVGYSYFNHFPH